MTGRPQKQLIEALQCLLKELWRVADRSGLVITADGDQCTVPTGGAGFVILHKCPTVQRPPTSRLPDKA